MNCSLMAPMTFSMEVEPLVDTVPLSSTAAGWLLPVLEAAGVDAAGAEPLETQAVRTAAVMARDSRVKIRFFISKISFSAF